MGEIEKERKQEKSDTVRATTTIDTERLRARMT